MVVLRKSNTEVSYVFNEGNK